MKNSVPDSHATRNRSDAGRSPYSPAKIRSRHPPPAAGGELASPESPTDSCACCFVDATGALLLLLSPAEPTFICFATTGRPASMSITVARASNG